jgi:hypothetical protein
MVENTLPLITTFEPSFTPTVTSPLEERRFVPPRTTLAGQALKASIDRQDLPYRAASTREDCRDLTLILDLEYATTESSDNPSTAKQAVELSVDITVMEELSEDFPSNLDRSRTFRRSPDLPFAVNLITESFIEVIHGRELSVEIILAIELPRKKIEGLPCSATIMSKTDLS